MSKTIVKGCDCVYNRKGLCSLNPPIPVVVDEWEESVNSMVDDVLMKVVQHVYPPAKFECQFQKMSPLDVEDIGER